jgi:hypothetical protein
MSQQEILVPHIAHNFLHTFVLIPPRVIRKRNIQKIKGSKKKLACYQENDLNKKNPKCLIINLDTSFFFL